MVSPTKIQIPERGTQGEIDALPVAPATSVPAGSSIFNTTTGVMNVTLNGGASPTWTIDSFPGGNNQILFNDGNGNVTSSSFYTLNESSGNFFLGTTNIDYSSAVHNVSTSQYTANAGQYSIVSNSFIINGNLHNYNYFSDINTDGIVDDIVRGRGAQLSPEASQNSDIVNIISWKGVAPTSLNEITGAKITVTVDNAPTSTSVPMTMLIQAIDEDDLSLISSISLSSAGNMDIAAQTRIRLFSNELTLTGSGNLLSFLPSGIASMGGSNTISITYPNEIILGTSSLIINSDNIVFSGDRFNYDGDPVNVSYAPATTMRVIIDETISPGDVLTASTLTSFRVVKVKSGDPDSIGVIGFAETGGVGAGDEIIISGASIFTVNTDTATTVSPGDPIEKSEIDDGQVQNSPSSAGAFGMAAESAAFSSSFKCWRRINESLSTSPSTTVREVIYVGSMLGIPNAEPAISYVIPSQVVFIFDTNFTTNLATYSWGIPNDADLSSISIGLLYSDDSVAAGDTYRFEITYQPIKDGDLVTEGPLFASLDVATSATQDRMNVSTFTGPLTIPSEANQTLNIVLNRATPVSGTPFSGDVRVLGIYFEYNRS